MSQTWDMELELRSETSTTSVTDGEDQASPRPFPIPPPSDSIIAEGAEAVVFSSTWRSNEVVVKWRRPKGYRDPDLDREVRTLRTMREARLNLLAEEAGIPVARLIFVDRSRTLLVFEHVSSPSLREALGSENPPSTGDAMMLGRTIRGLHGAGIIHGDLTPSNIRCDAPSKNRPNNALSPNNNPTPPPPDPTSIFTLIDMGMGVRSDLVEDMCVDLSVLEKTLLAEGHSDFYQGVWDGYLEAAGGASRSFIGRMDEVSRRRRYLHGSKHRWVKD